jgi:hypothetical protein
MDLLRMLMWVSDKTSELVHPRTDMVAEANKDVFRTSSKIFVAI